MGWRDSLAEDPGVIPNTHMTAHKHLLTPRPGDPIPSPGQHAVTKTYMEPKHTDT